MKINVSNIQTKSVQFVISLLSLAFISSCSSDDSTYSEISTGEASSEIISVTQTQFELGEMEFGSFTKQSFNKAINTTGVIDVPPENKSTVSAYFGGYVKNISLLEGQEIRKGQTLFTLENPDYIQVQQEFLESKSQLTYLESDYNRQKELAKDKVNSQKIYLKAESDYYVMLARYESLKKKLQLMNINPKTLNESNLRSTIVVSAPISGFITSVSALKGMFLNPSDVAVTIMNTDHIHIELNIFEKDLSSIAIGQEVSFTIQNNPTKFKATVHLINKAIDPVNRTVKVHCHLVSENESTLLTPGMFVEANIFTTNDSSLALPSEAVISADNKQYVLVKKSSSEEGFELEQIEVQIGNTYNNFIEILNVDELQLKDEILVKGAFNLIQD